MVRVDWKYLLLEPVTLSDDSRLVEYETPAAEFALSRLDLGAGQAYAPEKDEMQLALIADGAVTAESEARDPLQARQGEALLVPAGISCRISADRDADLWLAQVPFKKARR